MRSLAYLGGFCSGHGAWPPRPNIGASTNVFVNGKGVHRQGDPYPVHCDPEPHCHASQLQSGSSSVFVNGIPVGRIGDPVACGSVVAEGSNNVFAG